MTNTNTNKAANLLLQAASYERAALEASCGSIAMDYQILAQRARTQAAYWTKRAERAALWA